MSSTIDYEQIVKTQRCFVQTNQPACIEYRLQQLEALRKLILENQHLLTDAVFKDLRRDPRHTKVLEITPTLMEIDYCIANLKKWSEKETVEKTLVTIFDTPMIIREPLGVCLLIAPWNYPLLMIFLPMITMMAAGNTIVIKPSEIAACTSNTINHLLSTTFDNKYISFVQGGVAETTNLLKQRFDLIFYTGNGTVGKLIMKAASEHLTPVVLELGGKNPTIVLSDADIKISARRIVWGKFMNNGQTCLSPDYILCSRKIKQQLIEEIQQAIHEFYGPDCQTSKDYSRIINERHYNRIQSIIERSNARLIFKYGESDASDLFIPPHLFDLDECDKNDSLMEDEIFGPLLPIRSIDSLDEAIEILSEVEKPLAMYMFTRNEEAVEEFLSRTRSGAVTINDVVLHITVDTLPFGGVGNSGFGSYHGKFGFEQFSHKRAVLKRGFFGEGLGSCRYPPLTEKKVKQLDLFAVRRSMPHLIGEVISMWKVILIVFAVGVFVGHFCC